MTHFARNLVASSESISTPDRQGRMAKIVCLHCSHVVEDSTVSPAQCPNCGHTFPVADDSTQSRLRAPSTILAPPVELPRQIGRYLIEGELGHGGFGTVYRAWDPQLERPVAIKIPRADTARSRDAMERFAREGKSAAQLKHDGIVPVLTVEQVGDTPFIVSEFVEGVTLYHRLIDGPAFSFRSSAELVKALAEAVAHAHRHGVIHRDIKPKNIMIGTDGKPRLLDFGLARRETIDESITAMHHIIGTPGYMSPEQAWGQPDKVDRRTDIYSLGVVLYQLLTGEMPFRGEPRMILRQVIEEDPRSPRKLNAEIPIDLETICERAMDKEIDRRYQSADKLANELDRWLHNVPIESRPITRLERSWRWCKRNPLTSTLVGVIAVSLLLAALGATGMYASEHQRRSQVEQLLEEKNDLLSKSYIERANRYLGPRTEPDEVSPTRALPWLYAAFEIDQHDPKRWEASRIRLGTALRRLPSVERVWWHKGGITTAAISPTGDRFVTGGADGTAYIWDPTRDEPVTPAMIHPEAVRGAAFSGDGKVVVTGCADGSLRVWDTSTGKVVVGPLWDNALTKTKPATTHQDVRISSAGQYFLSVRGRNAQVWDMASGRPIGAPMVLPVAGSVLADSGKLVVAPTAASISVCDVQSGKERHRLPSMANTVAPIIAPDGITVAGTETPQSVCLWNCRTGEKVAQPLAHSATVTFFEFSPDNLFVATATADGVVHLWKVNDGTLLWSRKISTAGLTRLRFASDGHQLAAVSSVERLIWFLDVAIAGGVSDPIEISSAITLSEWAHDKGTFLTAGSDGAIRLWRTATEQSGAVLPQAGLDCASVSEDGRYLATVDRDGACRVTSLGREVAKSQIVKPSVQTGISHAAAVAVSPDGSKVAVADLRSAVSLWDVATANKIRDLAPGAPLAGLGPRLAFSTDGRWLFHLATRRPEHSGRINVWDTDSGARLQSERFDLDGVVGDFDLQSKGSLCAVAGGKQVIVWDAANGRRLGPILSHPKIVTSCRISADGARLVTGCSDGLARVWDLQAGKIVAKSQKEQLAIRCVAFSNDGAQFAAGCDDGTTRIWSTEKSVPLTDLLLQGGPVTGCFFSPDSRWLVTTSGDAASGYRTDPMLRGWDASTGEPVFVLPFPHLRRDRPAQSGGLTSAPSELQVAFFGEGSRRLHAVLREGSFATLSLEPDARISPELLREIVIRSGNRPDGAGGLSAVEPESLVRFFRREQ